MPQALLIPLLTTVGSSLISGVMGKAFGGGKDKEEKAAPAAAAKARQLFTPEQITQATDRYSSQNKAKWGQILSNMGAGGGTGVDPTSEIGSQATRMAAQLGGLTTESGYGDNPMSNLDAILKGVEGGITPKYSLYQ